MNLVHKNAQFDWILDVIFRSAFKSISRHNYEFTIQTDIMRPNGRIKQIQFYWTIPYELRVWHIKFNMVCHFVQTPSFNTLRNNTAPIPRRKIDIALGTWTNADSIARNTRNGYVVSLVSARVTRNFEHIINVERAIVRPGAAEMALPHVNSIWSLYSKQQNI